MTEPDRVAFDAVRRGGVVALAESRIHPDGKGTPRVRAYWDTVNQAQWTPAQTADNAAKREWCGVFALACYLDEGLAPPGARWIVGSGFAERMLPKVVRPERPEPGDLVVYFNKWHHAIVVSAMGDQLETIDGNQRPGVERKFREFEGAEHEVPGVYAYYSIRPWLDRAWANRTPAAG